MEKADSGKFEIRIVRKKVESPRHLRLLKFDYICTLDTCSVVVGRLIELVDYYSLRAIRFDHRYFFLYSINRYKLLYMLVNCFKIDLHISHHTF